MFKKVDSIKKIDHKNGSVFLETYSDGSFQKTKLMMNKKEGVLVIVKKDNKIVMVKHYRPEFEIESLEFPGGGVEHRESLEDVAKREVKEETGIIINNLKFLGKFFPSIHLRNWVSVFLADVKDIEKTQFKEDEEITKIKWYTKDEIEGMISNNKIDSAQTIAAFTIAQKYLK